MLDVLFREVLELLCEDISIVIAKAYLDKFLVKFWQISCSKVSKAFRVIFPDSSLEQDTEVGLTDDVEVFIGVHRRMQISTSHEMVQYLIRILVYLF